MQANEQVAALIQRFPGPSNQNIKDAGESEAAREVADAVLAAGPELVAGLVDLLAVPGQSTPEDARARFLLHVAVERAGATEYAARRKQLAAALAQTLASDRPKEVLGCVVRELEWIADSDTAPALGALLSDEALCHDAARALVQIGGDAAAKAFVAALPAVQGGPRLAVLNALGMLRAAAGVEALKAAAADADAEVRMSAVWGLANLGEPSAVAVVLKASEAEGYERIKQTKNCLLLAERLAAAGKKAEARQVYDHLRASRTDPGEVYVREAAERGLEALA